MSIQESPISATMLLEISRLLTRFSNQQESFKAVCEILGEAIPLVSCAIFLVDSRTGVLKPYAWTNLPEHIAGSTSIRMGDGIAGKVFETGETLVFTDSSARNAVCTPIKTNDRILGTLYAEQKTDSPTVQNPESYPLRQVLDASASLLAEFIVFRETLAAPFAQTVSASARVEVFPDLPPGDGHPFPDIIGTSDAMRSVFDLIVRVAPSEATVLITGESGTGKELAAIEIHKGSRRASLPFIRVNCAALPESIVESELFGHERGAFTGAVERRKGRFELARGGTIFLDEIGELSQNVQAKLLRILQEREFERVGGSETVKADVRIVAATNRHLEKEIAGGNFREDLFYRLNVFPVRMPSLRERKSDIMLLADHFAVKYANKNGKAIKRISSPAIDLLTSYHWPGNVRELENCMEHAVILSNDMVIHSYHLPPSLQSAESTGTEPSSTLTAALSRLEKEMIVEALKITEGNMVQASLRLGISERQMGLRVRQYCINWRQYRS